MGSLVLLCLWRRADLDFRFEVTAVVNIWLVLIVSGVLLNRHFTRRLRARH